MMRGLALVAPVTGACWAATTDSTRCSDSRVALNSCQHTVLQSQVLQGMCHLSARAGRKTCRKAPGRGVKLYAGRAFYFEGTAQFKQAACHPGPEVIAKGNRLLR